MKRALFLILLIAVIPPDSPVSQQLESRTADAAWQSKWSPTLNPEFTLNRGQWEDDVLYKTEFSAGTYLFTANSVTFYPRRSTGPDRDKPISRCSGWNTADAAAFDVIDESSIRTVFIDPDPDMVVLGDGDSGSKRSYFHGNDPGRWQSDVPSYKTVLYKDIWGGVDLWYRPVGSGIKYELVIAPGADVSQIGFRYEQMGDLQSTDHGALCASELAGIILEDAPVAFQETRSGRRPVECRHVFRSPGEFGFQLGALDPSLPTIIDPQLAYSSFFGGAGDDEGHAIALDDAGNIYITGNTFSSDFPVANAYDGSYNGGYEAFVSKFSPSGDSLIYSTYLGGSFHDHGFGIAVDNAGYAYIVGHTGSSDFPTVNAYDGSYGGSNDVFVTKISPDGSSLVFSTYLGGTGSDYGYGIAVRSSGEILVVGTTDSDDFPTVNPIADTLGGNGWPDIFVTEFSATGLYLIYSTYLGGSNDDTGYGVAVDNSGFAYIVGATSSPDFPAVLGYDSTLAGPRDAVYARLTPPGNSLVYSSYLGGGANDNGYAISIDGDGSVYLTGRTSSNDFPTVNPIDGSYNGADDVFVTKVDSAGDALIYSTYLGGTLADVGAAISSDSLGNALVSGYTISPNFPMRDPYDGGHNGSYDIFAAKISPAGDSLLYSTFLGGAADDVALGIAVDNSGSALIAGYTSSANFPISSPFDSTFNGSIDVVVVRFATPSTGIGDIPEIPLTFDILRNYPNPFNSGTVIEFSVEKEERTTIEMFDLLGRKIATLLDGNLKAGQYNISWDASGRPSGIYFCRLNSAGNSVVGKMTLIR